MDEIQIEIEKIGDGGIVRVKSTISPQRMTLKQALSLPVRVTKTLK